MDIGQNDYWTHLLSILNHIADAKFVAFDLEMSGIAMRSRFGPNPKGHDNGKPSLQALYDEVRSAAEQYQVLQVGITCVEEILDKEYYLARPYNFNLSPLLYQENRNKDRFPERKITFSSSAVDFLQTQGSFDIGKVFREGVYYLSLSDEEETHGRYQDRKERETSYPDVVIPPGDTNTLDFIRYARKIVTEWANSDKPEFDFVIVGDPKGGDLNGYQRMLVHQLVRQEFPGHRSFARGNQSFIQIEKLNIQREAQFQTKKDNEFKNSLCKQIGLRWIFEALTGGDFTGLQTSLLANQYSEDPELSQASIDKKFEEVKLKLQNKEHVIVGHNLFTDLVCLYKTFVGTLPLKVEDFQNRIHGLFPIIFDTKYVVTEGHNSMSTTMRKNLEELLNPFEKVHTTRFFLHENHTSYGTKLNNQHEAGFDSYMTAHLFAKMSGQLYQDRKSMEAFSDDEESLPSLCANADDGSSSNGGSDDDGGAKLFSPPMKKKTSNYADSAIIGEKHPGAWYSDQMQKIHIEDKNPYAILADVDEDISTGAAGLNPSNHQWIPAFKSSFWDIYINKLRVNGSEVGVCDLDEQFDR